MKDLDQLKENLSNLSSVELLKLSHIIESFRGNCDSEYMQENFIPVVDKVFKNTSLEK